MQQDVEENGLEIVGLHQQVGRCRFCGQTTMIQTTEEFTEPQADERATMNCECEGAKDYQDQATKKTGRRNVSKN